MVKALDLRSNVRMHTWVRTPFLVMGPCRPTVFSFFFFLLSSFSFSLTLTLIILQKRFKQNRRNILTLILQLELVSMETVPSHKHRKQASRRRNLESPEGLWHRGCDHEATGGSAGVLEQLELSRSMGNCKSVCRDAVDAAWGVPIR